MSNYEDIIDILRKNPTYELELRIGCFFTNHKFNAGVDYNTFKEVITDLSACDDLSKEESWHETMDVFFDHNKIEYRTRVIYSSSDMKVIPETIIKNKVAQCHVDVNANEYAFRISLSQEKKISNETVPSLVEPKYVRLKHIKHFYIINNGIRVWCIDLSKCWGAKTRTEVEEKQHTENPTYEIECELLDTTTYLNCKTNKHVFNSLILKGLSLLGIPGSKYEVYT